MGGIREVLNGRMSEEDPIQEILQTTEEEVSTQSVKPEVTKKEEGSPRGVKQSVSEDWPTGSECSQKVVVNEEEVTSVGLAIEDEADIHPFWSLLSQAGYTMW